MELVKDALILIKSLMMGRNVRWNNVMTFRSLHSKVNVKTALPIQDKKIVNIVKQIHVNKERK